jgi:hypothetical protein
MLRRDQASAISTAGDFWELRSAIFAEERKEIFSLKAQILPLK